VLSPSELAITDAYLDEFKKFVLAHPDLKISAAEIDADREFLRGWLRYELVTAHHGLETAAQVTALTDPQVQRALTEVPVAGKMAEAFKRQRMVGQAKRPTGSSE
jgi:hypothetical protein